MEDFKVSELMPEFKEECFGKKCNVEKLKKITFDIRGCFYDEQKNFCLLCYKLNELRNLFYSDECYYNAFETSDKRYPFEAYVNVFFGLDLRYVERCIFVYKKFMCLQVDAGVDLSVRYVECFQNFNKSKLFELLPVSIEQLKNDIRIGVLSPEMSKLQIREYVKSLKGGKKKENLVLEETAEQSLDEQEESLPTAFSPEKEYDYEFYKSKTKGDLVGYCVDFQRLVQKLLKKKK